MAKYGFDDLTIEVETTDGGTTETDVSAYVTEISAFGIEAILEDSHTAGDSWVEKLWTGLCQGNEFTLTGFYDDTASTGPDEIFSGIGETHSYTLTWGGSKTSKGDCMISKYERAPARGELTKYTVTLVPTGKVTEA